MADDTWPASLPQKLNQSGFSNTLPENTIVSSMDVGPDKRRRRDVSAPEPISGSIIIDETQYDTLVAFYNTVLGSGSLPFNWEHPITGATVEMVFTRPPSFAARSGDYYTASLNLEILT